MHRYAKTLFIFLATVISLAAVVPATASQAMVKATPVVYVEPPVTWQHAPVTFVVKHGGAYTRYRMKAAAYGWSPSMGDGGVIRMGVHRTNGSGKFKMHYEFGNRHAHFNGKPLEKWIVYAVPLHLKGGPYERVFVMAHGCGCGTR